MTPALATERMVLQPLRAGDHVQIQRLFPQWEVVKYLNDRVPWPFPEDGVLEYQRDFALPAIARGEEWHWTLRLLEQPGGDYRGDWVVCEFGQQSRILAGAGVAWARLDD